MDLMYSSTRNPQVKLTASQAILKGLADDGGLFVPEAIPALSVSLDELAKMSYQETAYAVMSTNKIPAAFVTRKNTPVVTMTVILLMIVLSNVRNRSIDVSASETASTKSL